MTSLDPAVELLDRALSYTRVILNEVTDADLTRRTPCERWDLGRLLAHMEDGLDAFAEGAGGEVDLADRTPARVRVRSLQHKACALMSAWSGAAPATVRIGEHAIDTPVVVLAAALEITVHGWDVGTAIGADRPVPDALAEGLLPVAEALVAGPARGSEFAPPRPVGAEASPAERLLGYLGRDAHPGKGVARTYGQIRGNRGTGDAAAS